MSDELPHGWATTSFMDVFDIQGGTQPPKSTFKFESTSGYVRLLQIRDFGEKPVPTFVQKKPTLKTCQKDDVLIGRYGASVGRICTGMEGAYNVALAKVMMPEEFERRFVYHLLGSPVFQRPIVDIERSAQNGFNKQDLAEIFLPFAPLPEQRRIVAKLEALLAKVDVCQQRLAKIPVLLKRFRQSVLAAACSGRLTADWREENRFEDWREVTLADVISDKPKNGYSAKPVKHQTRWRVLTLTATTSGRFNDQHFKYFEEMIPKASPLWLQPGDILVQRGNTAEYVGVPAIYDGKPNEFVYPDLMMRFRANERVDTKFLYFALSWERTRNFLRERATGTAGNMPKINQSILMAAPIPVPPIAEQQEIVRRVEGLFALANQIESRFKKARAHVDKLTQSILAKAFRGELVPQDPNDEPASVLLERIKAAKSNGSSPVLAASVSKPLRGER